MGKKKRFSIPESEELEQIKKLVMISMFADDDLMNRLVLKGGNALDLVYKVGYRGSLDFDFSIPDEFNRNELGLLKPKFERALNKILNEKGYVVFDAEFREALEDTEAPSFWGGYILEFKVIAKNGYARHVGDQRGMRLEAIDAGPGSVKIFRVEISKREACKGKSKELVDNYTIYVYTPAMIVFEKLRAICQQMPAYYQQIGRSHNSPRSRDFFDIFATISHFNMDITTKQNLQLLTDIFEAKKVPLGLIKEVKDFREFHRPDFSQVKDTVKQGIKIYDFDYYFDYVVGKCDELAQSLGIK